MTTSKAIVGFKNVKYGLIKPSEIQQKSGLFSIEDDTVASKKNEQVPRSKQKKTQQLIDDIIAKDPYAFAYDEVLPEIKKQEKKKNPKRKANEEDIKPKYVGSLLSSAKERERNNNVLYQRKLYRELEQDRQKYGEETDKFITAAYKKQLAENLQYEEEERKKLEQEKKNDVIRKGQDAWGEFYRNVLDQKNIAIGGASDGTEDDVGTTHRPTVDLGSPGRKRNRSSSSESDSDEEKERDRRRRNRIRAEEAALEAEKIREAREIARGQKITALQQEYAKHATGEDEVEAAKKRYLERQKARNKEREEIQNQLNNNLMMGTT